MENALPVGVRKYAETPLYDEKSVPDKLTSKHNLKAGVWGRLCVIAGKLEYNIPDAPSQTRLIDAGGYLLIKPEQVHFVAPVGHVEFKVEFYR